ncbi:ATP-dependent dethiobiotin synthetase BioD [Patulibacter sp.]|uniref:ATP-dependent dethiobiotin synthetase BioD n=1 Tax=Patulibacter sp. TaxID=1912859 RepID=UPI002715BCE6|nr:ATP-dependent dethiobiotin synthetase BioD [Patulibacter sp.]MDO9408043.1 ATP-dependent dethiobiotin synthetase BioD [Patulibacter sp.]
MSGDTAVGANDESGRTGAPPLCGVVVVATDSDVGRTVLAAAICARLRDDGTDVVAHAPAVTGLDEPAPDGGRDHELLAACTGQEPVEVCPRTFGPAVPPHLAAELAAERLVPADLVAAAARTGVGRTLVVEGTGGLLAPFDRAGYDVRALCVDLGLPVVVAARPGPGAINHVRLTVDVARAAGLDVRAIVLTPWAAGDVLADDARRTVAALTDVPTHVMPLAEPTPAGLADAASELPVASWIGEAVAPLPPPSGTGPGG